jgi:hypothetical protein
VRNPAAALCTSPPLSVVLTLRQLEPRGRIVTATLNVQFIDPPDPALPSPEPIRTVLTQAFNEWTRHFDYTTGSYTINVSFRAFTQPADVSLNAQDLTQVGLGSVLVQSFGLRFAGRAADPVLFPNPTMFVNPAYLTDARATGDALAPMERELGHALGIRAFVRNIVIGTLHQFTSTIYDKNVTFVQRPPNAMTTFNGPNAQAVYGEPVPVVNASPDTTTVGGGAAVDTITEGAGTVQPLDVALLRDAGLPALSDQELGEHQVARLYVAAFGRAADSAGLALQYGALRSGQSLAQVAAGFTSSAEYANHYGSLSNAEFVNALYQNVLGRPGDAAGVQNFRAVLDAGNSRSALLAGFADSDEARGRLNGNPNVAYAATAEAQVARVYDTAFGRDADPAGFNLFTQAVIKGTSLQQVALSFLSSPEFANRYGASPSDQALVDGLYQNTLQRAPDAAGEALFVQALASGLSRADLLISFSDSQEHINLVAQRAGARDAAGYNVDLQPHLGIIPVVSARVTT